ncbi:MAG: MarC family protein [Nanoarchaeota archaeon]
METYLAHMLEVFVTLLIIVDPFLSLAVFISLTKKMKSSERAAQALLACGVALGLLIVFLFVGAPLLKVLGIDMASFKVAGGVILLLMGIQSVLGIEFGKQGDYKVAAVVIGTPLMSGPGALTSIIIYAEKFGYTIPLIASIVVIAITWVMLAFSDRISRWLGDRMLEVLSRVLGLILAALSVGFIRDGVVEMIHAF